MSYSKNKDVDPSIHVMNKNERKALRQLKAKTGESEEIIRQRKVNRKILSQAQKQTGDKTPLERSLLRIQKEVTKELKLPKEHPLVKEALINKFNEKRNQPFTWSRREYYHNSNEQLLNILQYLNNK